MYDNVKRHTCDDNNGSHAVDDDVLNEVLIIANAFRQAHVSTRKGRRIALLKVEC